MSDPRHIKDILAEVLAQIEEEMRREDEAIKESFTKVLDKE